MAEPQFPDARTVLLKGVRFSFTDTLLTPGTPKGVSDATPKYGCNIINEKDSKHFADNDRKIRAAMSEAGRQFKNDEDLYKKIIEKDAKRVAYRKGERFRNDEGKVYDGYEGNFAISATGPRGGKDRPTLKDRRKRDITQNDKDIPIVCYSGTYGDAVVSFYATDKGGLGIFCSIEVLRSHEEGDRIGGGRVEVSDDVFDDLEDDDSFDDDTGGSAGASDDDMIG